MTPKPTYLTPKDADPPFAGGVSPLRKRRDIVDLDKSTDLPSSLRFRCGTSRAGGWAVRGGGDEQGRRRQHSRTAIESVHCENGEKSPR